MSVRSLHLPSFRALAARDEQLLTDELQLLAFKRQIAVVRALADEVERCLLRGGESEHLREQLAQELAHLGAAPSKSRRS